MIEFMGTQTLIFFYIHEIMIYQDEVENIINSLKKQILRKGEIKVIILRDYAAKSPVTGKFSFTVSLGMMVPRENSEGCDFLELDKSEDREERLSIDEVRRYFKAAFQDSTSMRKIFITFSHSTGFAINTNTEGSIVNLPLPIDVVVNPPLLINSHSIVNENGYAHVSATSKYQIIDKAVDVNKNVNNKLWIYDLAKILDQVLEPEERIDLMLMVNCNMQILDTLFQLKRKVKILVASQTQFSYYGFHYVALLTTLNKYLEISPPVLAVEIVRQFSEKYVYHIQDGISKLTCNTLFAHDLTYVHQLMEVVNNVSDYLFKLVHDPPLRKSIHELREKKMADVTNYPGHFLNYDFIDFGGFLMVLSKGLDERRNGKLRVYLKMYRAIMKSMNLANFIGEKTGMKKENLTCRASRSISQRWKP